MEDGDPEIRLRLPFHRPLRRLIHGEIVPPLPPADEVEPAPRLAPLDLAEPREPPWMLRRVLRPRRNGVAPGNMEQEFVGNANEGKMIACCNEKAKCRDKNVLLDYFCLNFMK